MTTEPKINVTTQNIEAKFLFFFLRLKCQSKTMLFYVMICQFFEASHDDDNKNFPIVSRVFVNYTHERRALLRVNLSRLTVHYFKSFSPFVCFFQRGAQKIH